MSDIVHRPRRLRRTEAIRRLVRETELSPAHLIYPMFVTHERQSRDIPSMPGIRQLSVPDLCREADRAASAHLGGILLFGIPAVKDEEGTEAYAEDGIVVQAVSAVRRTVGDSLLIAADVCLCEYTSHGHCGVVRDGDVVNDATVELLAQAALCYAAAGADIVAPSDMMDGRVRAIRETLDADKKTSVAILAYSAKYASAFYGPFRDAAGSAPQFGDRRTYQMDPPNRREALREIELDVEEGADIVMVKPGLPFLDVLREARDQFDVPLAVYNVSGEYSMLKAAARNGWIDEMAAVTEVLTAFKRAGADVILSYHALDYAGGKRGTGA